ncbi:MAG: histidine kinase [Bacteroidales bacterium]|nr:histidine kinase [Bacteroidales bacterium]
MKVKKIIYGILIILGLSVIGLMFYYALWLVTDEEFRRDLQESWPLKSGWILIDYISCCMFTAVITIYYWRSRERTEKERDKFRLQVLENQLSPHFVFNNFSILADLIEVDSKRASEYLMNLSKVYRYTLTHLDHNTVTIKEELEFLQRYLALLQQRFGDSIQVNFAPELYELQGELPPAALQMLIENAIKHNEHTAARPLFIDITCSGQQLRVTNNKKPISTAEQQVNGNSANVGLHNITERYQLLTKQKVIIDDMQDKYCVTIPIITTKK